MADIHKVHESWEPVVQRYVESGIPAEEKRERVAEMVRERIAEARQAPQAQQPVQPQAPSTAPLKRQDVHPKERELRALDAKDQIIFLAHLALEEGVEPAVALAERIGSDYVIDAFHDLLVDRLLDIIARRAKSAGA